MAERVRGSRLAVLHPLTRADVASDLSATSPRWGEVRPAAPA